MNVALIHREIGLDRADWLCKELSGVRYRSLQPASVCPFLFSGNGSINCIDIDASENRYLLASFGNSVRIFDVDSRRFRAIHKPNSLTSEPIAFQRRMHRKPITNLSWYPHDTGLFYSSSFDGTVKIWDTNSLSEVYKFDIDSEIHGMSIPQGTSHSLIAASGAGMDRIVLCDTSSGAATHCLVGHKGGCRSIQWSPRNEYLLVSGGEDHTVRLWDIRKSGFLHCFDQNYNKISKLYQYSSSEKKKNRRKNWQPLAHEENILSVHFTNDGLYLLSLDSKMNISLWDTTDYANCVVNFHTLNVKNSHYNNGLAISSDDSVMAVGLGQNIGLYNLHTGDLLQKITENYVQVNSLIFHPSLEELYSADTNGRIVVHTPPEPENSKNEKTTVQDEDEWSD